tara:strand:- start:286 stop:759 length:474 start_codon:yes stop_codon:yes gene_type:complete
MEIFKEIKGYEDSYKVSNFGRVKSSKRKGRFLKGSVTPQGYLIVALSKKGVVTRKTIHQLVAIAFLDHKPDGLKTTVDHVDNNKLNNSIKNLQLTTNRENTSKDRKNKTSRFTGVCWHKTSGKWRSSIYFKGKQKHLGYFTAELEASNAYQKALHSL